MTNEKNGGPRVLRFQNRQRVRPVNVPLLRRLTLFVLREHPAVRGFELCFHLVDAPEMARVNEQFLGHTGSTDVITFDLADDAAGRREEGALCGEVFISVPDAVTQAGEFGTTWQSELARYVIHALLHLRGFDDLEPAARRVMKREENRLVKLVERTFTIRQLGGRTQMAGKS
jgi:probable rRNA maturation factor